MTRKIQPSVNEKKEYWGAVEDFSDKREIIREAISNSIDAKSTNIKILINIDENDESMTIQIEDDGQGMSNNELEINFFGLGETTKDGTDSIGEKGHGTKTYICCERLYVSTRKNALESVGVMHEPLKHKPEIPMVDIEDSVPSNQNDGTNIIMENIAMDHRDLDKFKFGPLKAYIQWHTAGGKSSWIWDKNHFTTHIHLKVEGYSDDSSRLRQQTVKNNGEESFSNRFSWEEGGNEDVSDVDSMYMYYQPEEIELGENGHTLRLAFATLGKNSKDRILSGTGNTVAERMGVYLSKDGINIEHYGERFLTTGQEWANWLVLVDTKGWSLTQNRGSIKKDSFYDDVIEIVKEKYKEKTSPKETGPLENEKQHSQGRLDFSKLNEIPVPPKETSTPGVIQGGKKETEIKPKVDNSAFIRTRNLAKNQQKIDKFFKSNSKNMRYLVEHVSPNLVKPDDQGRIQFSNTPAGLVIKCQNLSRENKIEVEFTYPVFSKSDSIPWIGSVIFNGKRKNAVFHPRFKELVSSIPLLSDEMIIIVDRHYKLPLEKVLVYVDGIQFGTCEISKIEDKLFGKFEPLSGDKAYSIEVIQI